MTDTPKPRTRAKPKLPLADWRTWLTAVERAEAERLTQRIAADTEARQLLMNRAKQRRHRGAMPKTD